MRRGRGGGLSQRTINQVITEMGAEREERDEQERLYQEQQTALGNPPRPRLPYLYADGTPEKHPLDIQRDRERLDLCSLESWDIAVYLVRHGEFETRKQLCVFFDKPEGWATKVLQLMVKQRIFSEIEIEFLVPGRRS